MYFQTLNNKQKHDLFIYSIQLIKISQFVLKQRVNMEPVLTLGIYTH